MFLIIKLILSFIMPRFGCWGWRSVGYVPVCVPCARQHQPGHLASSLTGAIVLTKPVMEPEVLRKTLIGKYILPETWASLNVYSILWPVVLPLSSHRSSHIVFLKYNRIQYRGVSSCSAINCIKSVEHFTVNLRFLVSSHVYPQFGFSPPFEHKKAI